MVNENNIKNIQEKLTEEQLNKFLYYLSKDKILELKDLARKKVIIKAIKPMRRYNKISIEKLYNNPDIPKETVNLLNQCNMTLKNIYKLIENKSIVDANTLLRSCFENLTMAMVINNDDKVYKEFIDLSVTDETRKKTKPQHVRNEFRKILKLIDYDLEDSISNKQLKKLLDEFYDKLCLFTHSTLIVNAMIEIKKNNSDDVYLFDIKQNAYFLELMLYACLKFLNRSNKYFDMTYIVIGYYVMLSDINIENLNAEKIEQMKEFLYFKINTDYFNKNQKDINEIKEQFLELKKNIEDNPMIVFNILTELVK